MAIEWHRRTERLHLGRFSMSGAIYFVTFVTARREPWLSRATASRGVLDAIRGWHAENDGAIYAATVMPDHVHILFELGRQLEVGRCVARWKAVGRQKGGYAGEWQRDFWEHRLREDESTENYGLYVLLNPYRAGLVKASEPWPWWWMPLPDRFGFAGWLGPRGEPPVEWIGWPEDRFAPLATGE